MMKLQSPCFTAALSSLMILISPATADLWISPAGSPGASDPAIAEAFCGQTQTTSEYIRTFCYNSTHVGTDYGDCLSDGSVNISEWSGTHIESCPEWSRGSSLTYCHECGSKVSCADDSDPETVCSDTPTNRSDGVHPEFLPCSDATAASRLVQDRPCYPNQDGSPSNTYVDRNAYCDASTGDESLPNILIRLGCRSATPYCHQCGGIDFCAASVDVTCPEFPTQSPTQSPTLSPTTAAPTEPPTSGPTSDVTTAVDTNPLQANNNNNTSGAVVSLTTWWGNGMVLCLGALWALVMV